MKTKYLEGFTMEEWFRLEWKVTKGSSIVWKALVDAFSLVGNWIIWKMRDEKNTRIGEDTWVGIDEE